MDPIVLLHSPLTSATAWGRLPQVLRGRGFEVVVPEVLDDDEPPYAGRYVGRAAVQLRALLGSASSVLVAHSGAGALLPQLGLARRAAEGPVSGYVFLDAGLPRVLNAASRLELMYLEDPEFAEQLESSLRQGARFPDWSDADLRQVVPDDGDRAMLLAGLRPRALDYFTEQLLLSDDWPDAPAGYVQLSTAYAQPAATAHRKGWPVVTRESHHFAALTDPDTVADALVELLAELWGDPAGVAATSA